MTAPSKTRVNVSIPKCIPLKAWNDEERFKKQQMKTPFHLQGDSSKINGCTPIRTREA
jgi:hypothetical protein